jgi:uncharacterized membrane protein HdeD (DUF308 family)
MMPAFSATWLVFVGVTLVLAGGAAHLTGQAMAQHWRSRWLVVLYMCLLGLANRFVVYALFDGPLLSLGDYLVDTAVLIAIGSLSYQRTRARYMVRQYPWLYEPRGPFGWREKQHQDAM